MAIILVRHDLLLVNPCCLSQMRSFPSHVWKYFLGTSDTEIYFDMIHSTVLSIGWSKSARNSPGWPLVDCQNSVFSRLTFWPFFGHRHNICLTICFLIPYNFNFCHAFSGLCKNTYISLLFGLGKREGLNTTNIPVLLKNLLKYLLIFLIYAW